ncbi:hypothetical protein DVH24_000172 [Malus domestica]|uniref:Pentacotripeptide-repeat region of PRORP domain-containing protein n=1 Tax=Malus domestica TaxID=3750 RepID=A0A498J3Z8_MALDO|nr:hypothetical protein DVH24_000172 [Malus domestica]
MKENGCPPTVFTYTELMKGLGRARRCCKPDVVLMNNLINILGKEGHIEDVIKMFNEMSSLHCTPNVVTYNIVIKALFESRSPASEAATWFEKMKVNGIVPSSFTYSILIDGF